MFDRTLRGWKQTPRIPRRPRRPSSALTAGRKTFWKEFARWLRRTAAASALAARYLARQDADCIELAPELMAEATIVVDVLAQAATMGDLHHALAAGRVTLADVHAELGDLVIGRKPGRTSPEEITVFDSTGTAILDAASAVAIYERAVAAKIGSLIDFGAH